MTEIYLIRHTQAEGNLYRIMQGHWDGAVTEAGRAQVDALAERFRDIPIDALYSSDLYRTRFTASAITRTHDVPLQTTQELREINMGRWEARFFGDLCYHEPELMADFRERPDEWSVPEGESCGEVTRRMLRALTRIAEENDGHTVAVVSHGMAIRCAIAGICGTTVAEQPIVRNTAVNRLRYEDGHFTILSIDDIDHLTPSPSHAWNQIPILRAAPLCPEEDADFYTSCYADAWTVSHGSLSGFLAGPYLQAARRHSRSDKNSVLKLFEGDSPAGLVDLDPDRGSASGYGWISLLYLFPEYRHRQCGIQALGRAIMYYRSLGRTTLRLNVAEENSEALSFYKKYGFRVLSEEPGSIGTLYLMEAEL